MNTATTITAIATIEKQMDQPPARPTPRLRLINRDLPLGGLTPEQLLPHDDPARTVWEFAAGLDLGPLYASIKAVQGHPGRHATDPRLLFCLWLYATLDGVGSARLLARRCRLHLSFLWLCGGVRVNHRLLSDFRTDHAALLDQLLTDSVAAMLCEGLASLEETAQDGLRIRASAGSCSFRRQASLERCRDEAERHLLSLRQQEQAGTSARQRAARRRAAQERGRRVQGALSALDEIRQKKQQRGRPDEEGKPGKEPRASTTDPQARRMKMPDGGYRPAYNAQLTTTVKGGLIVGVDLSNAGADYGQVLPMLGQLEQRYGEAPKRHLVDGGFVSKEDIEAAHTRHPQTKVYAPPKEDKQAAPAPLASAPGASEGPTAAGSGEGKQGKKKAARKKKDTPGVAAWRERMATEEGKQAYKRRSATAELSNAQVRNRGLYRVLVRGLLKVRAVLLWHALAHNLMRRVALRAEAARRAAQTRKAG